MGQLSSGQERLFYSFTLEDQIPAKPMTSGANADRRFYNNNFVYDSKKTNTYIWLAKR
jgi:hypothetical protein